MIRVYGTEMGVGSDYLVVKVKPVVTDVADFVFSPSCYDVDDVLDAFDKAVNEYRMKLDELVDTEYYVAIDRDTPWTDVKGELNDLGEWEITDVFGEYEYFKDYLNGTTEWTEDMQKYIDFALRCSDFEKLDAYLNAFNCDLVDFDSYEDYASAVADKYIGQFSDWRELCEDKWGDMDCEFGYHLDFILDHVGDEDSFFEDYWNDNEGSVVEADGYWFYDN